MTDFYINQQLNYLMAIVYIIMGVMPLYYEGGILYNLCSHLIISNNIVLKHDRHLSNE